jgi:hypothetical protein
MNTEEDSHDELAQLYVTRGESYLLDAQYEKAVEDFYVADSQTEYVCNIANAMIVAFRTAFGLAVCYDNLGMQEEANLMLEQLKGIASNIGCDNCARHKACSELIFSAVINKRNFQNG